MLDRYAAAGMKAIAGMLTSANVTRAPKLAQTRDQSEQSATASQLAAEYWAKRIMWLLVTVTFSWDIAVTFDKHFAIDKAVALIRACAPAAALQYRTIWWP